MTNFSGRAVIADPRPLSRAGIAAIISGTLSVDVVGHADTFSLLLDQLAETECVGLITLALDLPGLGGVQAVKRLRQLYPDARIAIVGGDRQRSAILDALMAGAHGYVPDHLPADAMAGAFRTIIEGRLYVPATVADLSAPPRAPASAAPSSDGPDALTGRQRDVLELLATGKSNKEIGRALRIAESTVKIHVTAAFRRLGVRNRLSAMAHMQQTARTAPREEPMFVFAERRRVA